MKSLPVFGACLKMIDIGATINAMQKHDTDPLIASAAREFIERCGETATEIARQRANALSMIGSSPEHDRVLLLLSAVEELSITNANGEVD